MPVPGLPELGLILLIVAMLFGVGKLPEVFGAVGKGIREFKRESSLDIDMPNEDETPNTNSTTETAEQV